MRLFLTVLATILLFPADGLAGRTLIHAGNLIDGVSGKVAGNSTVVVEGQRIAGIRSGCIAPGEGDEVVDLSDSTVLPGLMDLHTHLSMQLSKASYNEGFRSNPGDFAFRMVPRAEKTLLAGFTTVRELGDRHNLSISLRNAIDDGLIPGPRVFSAGKSLATTGGHADPTNSLNFHLMGNPGPLEGVVNGVADSRRGVRQRYKDGADWIKITATGGVLSEAKNGMNPQFRDDELEAVVQTAADYGMKVAAHAHGTEGMLRAVLAGVASIEHGTFMDEEVMKAMVQRGTYLVPTMMAGETVLHMAETPGMLPEIVVPKALAIGPRMKITLGNAYRAGVKIAFGTDCGVSAHGTNGREFRLMVEAGVPPMAAIESATRVAAELLDVQDDLGTLEAGKLADIIAVPGNPMDDITVMERVEFVMKEGTVYRN